MNQSEGSYRKIDILVIFCTILPLIFIIWATPAYAKETIDLQRYSSCDELGYCKTEVDINELDLSKDGKDLIKSIESDTVYSLEMSHSIENYRISIVDKEKLIITGRINRDTYWTADFGSILLDPWWNLTGTCNSSTQTYTYGGGMIEESAGGYWHGINITTNASNVTLVSFVSDDYSTGGRAVIANATTHEFYADVAFVGHTATFNYDMKPNARYIILVTNYTGAEKKGATGEISPFAIATTVGVQIDGSVYSADPYSTWNRYVLKLFELYQLNTYINVTCPNIWYENHLYMNGNETNITLDNATTFNATATTNLTGANVLIWFNTTLSANGTDSATNSSNLTEGLWNITAFFGNVSTNETITWWLNMTYAGEPAPPEANYSYTYIVDMNDAPLQCLNSTHAYRAMWVNGASLNETYECPNDCDEQSNTGCNPPEYQQGLFNFAIVCGMILFMVVIWRWRR